MVAAVLTVITLVWGGIVRPVGDALSSARERHARAIEALADAEMQMTALTALQQTRPAPMQGTLDAEIRNRASAAGFALGNVTLQGNDRVQIAIASARPAALFGWIAGLEASGLIVDSLSTTNNGDQTIAVQMTLRTRGL